MADDFDGEGESFEDPSDEFDVSEPTEDTEFREDGDTALETPVGESAEGASVSSSPEVDDSGNPYKTEDGSWIPNNKCEVEGVTFQTDDSGKIYSVDGKLKYNDSYELNGNSYTTDDKGRIVSCEAKPVLSPENPRDNEAQLAAGGKDRRPTDQGGHIVGRDMNGDGGIGNLTAMDSRINQSDYRRMENDIKTDLADEKDVTTRTELTYNGDSQRPDKISVTVNSDGKDTVYEYDNNIDGSLDSEIYENSPSGKAILEEYPDAHVSSLKREYDEKGDLVRTTAYITRTDENGSNRRSAVVIENDRKETEE